MVRAYAHRNWGGKRVGAGRPSGGVPTRNISITLPEELIQVLDRHADRRQTSRSAVIAHYLIQGLAADPAHRPTEGQGGKTDPGKAANKTLKRR